MPIKRILMRAVAVAAALMAACTAAPAHAAVAPAVTCSYRFIAWPGGFSAELSVANGGPAIDGWMVNWAFSTPTRVMTSWSAQLTQANPVDVVATPPPWSKVIGAGSTLSFGWTAMAPATEIPAKIYFNGAPC